MAQPLSPTRVLVIDDDEMSRDLLAILLEAGGYQVSCADSGDSALDLLDSARPLPGVILTDMQMPGSTPGQLAGRLRRACGRGPLLLAMSGSQPTPPTLARYDGFLLKPFGASQLTSAIETARSAHPAAHAAKKTSAALMPGKPVRIAKKPAANKPPASKPPKKESTAVLDLAASAADPASKHAMDASPASVTPAVLSPRAEVSPVLDETIYRQLANSMPAPQLHEMYAMCVNDARSRIASMRSLAAAHDSAQFMRQAHTVKGSCGMLGATELHRIAASLEKCGPDPAGGDVNSLDELSHACDRLERMLGERA